MASFIYTLVLVVAALVSQTPMGLGQVQAERDVDPVKSFLEPVARSLAPQTVENELRISVQNRYQRKHAPSLLDLPTGTVIVKAHWFAEMNDLPVQWSDAILRATLVDFQPHLADDNSFIFTTYQLQAEEILFQSGEPQLLVGDVVTAERLGGAIQLPSGEVLKYIVDGQGFPRLGDEYVVFLRKRDIAGGRYFEMLTGYQLGDQTVTPFDDWPPGYAGYSGVEVDRFLTMIRETQGPKVKNRQ